MKNSKAKITKTNTEEIEAGEYTALVTFTGSESFTDTEKNLNLTILEKEKIQTTITDTHLTCENGETTVHIEAQDESIINEGIIRVYVGDTCMANGQVKNNSALIKQNTNLTVTCPPGDYNGTIIYEGTDTYERTEKTVIITVPEHDTLPTVEIIENTLNINNNTIKIHLNSENNQTIDCGIVTLELNNKKLISEVIDNTATFTNLDLKTETYQATATYTCNNQHYQNTTKEITIKQGDGEIKIQIEDITTNYNSKASITGTLLDEYNNPINDATINLTILKEDKTKTYTLTTDTEGKYTLAINLAPGEYTVKTQYLQTEKETKLIINKANTQINTEDYTGTYGISQNFTGKILTIDNTPVIGETVGLKLTRLTNKQSKTYYVTTNENGEYSLPINLAPGDYTVETIIPETNKYTETSILNAMKIF